MKTALVLGAGGFIGSHMVSHLKKQGFWVRGVDKKNPEFGSSSADDFLILDLRDRKSVSDAFSFAGVKISDLAVRNKITSFEYVLNSVASNTKLHFWDEVYQFAADMGGAGFVFTGENDSEIMHNSAMINLLVSEHHEKIGKLFYSSSACIYPERNQMNEKFPECREGTAYPAQPDSEYGWEKIFSERFYGSMARNQGLNIRVARYHNIFGPMGTYKGGREKAPAALCRKVALAKDGDTIEIWGDGKQTRSFLFIDECIKATKALVDSSFTGPVNIGSEEMISINDLAKMIIKLSEKDLKIKNIEGPVGVRGRNSDNTLFKTAMGWAPSMKLEEGIRKTYRWIESEIKKNE